MRSKKESEENPHVAFHRQRSPSVDGKEQQEAIVKKLRDLRIDMAVTFGSPEGKRVLRWLLNQCGFFENGIGGNPAIGLDAVHGTIYNNARRNVYAELRKMIPHSILKEVEFENIQEEIQ